MLKEIPHVRQFEGEPHRRWFEDEYFDLIVWFDPEGGILEFELCYDKGKNQRALRWETPNQYSHFRVDDGEHHAGRGKASPVLLRDPRFDREKVFRQFEREAAGLEYGIVKLVCEKISQCPLRKTADRKPRA
ncbi:MAG: hypothetical protein ACREOO_00470 [bacterium]